MRPTRRIRGTNIPQKHFGDDDYCRRYFSTWGLFVVLLSLSYFLKLSSPSLRNLVHNCIEFLIKPEETRRTQRLRVGLDASAATARLTSSASLKPTVSHLLCPSPPFCASRPRKSLRLFYLLCHTPFRSAWPASLATASRCRPRLVLVWVVHSHASEVPSSPCLWWPPWRMTSRNSSSGLRHRSSYGVSYVRVCFANFRYPSWWTMAHTKEARTLPQVILESSLRAGLSA